MIEHAPYLRKPNSVTQVMFTVLLALVPAIAVYIWQFGIGVLVSLCITSLTALIAEALVLKARHRPIAPHLMDGSALVTAWLVTLSIPPILPWWTSVLAALIAIVIAKHLYGGLGQNPFNPAMVAFAALIVAYPSLMSQWPNPNLSAAEQIQLIFGAERSVDAITAATPIDAMRTGLKTGHQTLEQIKQGPAFGFVGGRGWEWIALAYLLGGLILKARAIITLHAPIAFLTALAAIASLCWVINPEHFATPLFHLASGGTLLAAAFIVTDPVSGATTPRGKILFGIGTGLLAYIIRVFGASFPDGIAFAVLIMNTLAPLLDMKTQPKVFGHKHTPSP